MVYNKINNMLLCRLHLIFYFEILIFEFVNMVVRVSNISFLKPSLRYSVLAKSKLFRYR